MEYRMNVRTENWDYNLSQTATVPIHRADFPELQDFTDPKIQINYDPTIMKSLALIVLAPYNLVAPVVPPKSNILRNLACGEQAMPS
jgi:hypothetical protein